ncbi:TetR/AcrR family transcriptional regulator [Curtobacterium sp. MCBD17_034]|nr:TetR/AcrR family transcriptional regulator [Curtobacterium sp. MCBD17_034]PZM39776.1 TetR/AcrR family transcriptional regulator [Curtobacterium sp. MCBD17_031]
MSSRRPDVATTTPRTRKRPALDRVVQTADRLFYADGIHATGVDTIADAANVSKATMYTYFRTKDDLVGAYVEGRSLAWRDHLTTELAAADVDAAEQILMVFDLLGTWFTTDDFNGCPFINAEAESTTDSPAHVVNVEHRTWIRALFTDLASRAGTADPAATAIRLAMLYDGAMVGAHTEPQLPWAAEARDAAAVLIAQR